LFVAAAVRLYWLGGPSLWKDERDSILTAVGRFSQWESLPTNRIMQPPDLFSVAGAGPLANTWHTYYFHPPLYPLLLRIWLHCVGETDAQVRGLSVLASLASILLLFDLGRTLVDARAALWACAIFALAEPEIMFAQEARAYALWTALGLGAAAAAARLAVLGGNWRRAAALGACALGMILTDILAISTAMALAVWCLNYLRGRALRQAMIAAALAVALTLGLVAAGTLPAHALHTGQVIGWASTSGGAAHDWSSLRAAALLPALFLAAPTSNTGSVALLGAVAFVLCWLLCRWPRGANRNGAMLFCALWLWAGVLPIIGSDLFNATATIHYVRFTLIAAPAYYLLISSLPLRAGLRALAPLAAVIGCAAAVPYEYDSMAKGDWRSLGGDVRRFVRPGDVLLFANSPDAYLANPHQLYDSVNCYVRQIPCPVALLDRPAEAPLLAQLRGFHRVWVVSSAVPGDLQRFLPRWRMKPAESKRVDAAQLWKAEDENSQ